MGTQNGHNVPFLESASLKGYVQPSTFSKNRVKKKRKKKKEKEKKINKIKGIKKE